jgi:hypothetical protein
MANGLKGGTPPATRTGIDATAGRDADMAVFEGVVTALLAERFPEARVSHVVVREDRDFDDDRILRITVVMASGIDTLDQVKLLGFVPALRPVLAARDPSVGFPIVSFVSEREAGKLKLEAA